MVIFQICNIGFKDLRGFTDKLVRIWWSMFVKVIITFLQSKVKATLTLNLSCSEEHSTLETVKMSICTG